MIAKIWKDPVWSKVISTVILGSFAYLCNLWSNGWVLLALKTAWSWIVAFLFFEIAIIWIICGFIGLILNSIPIRKAHSEIARKCNYSISILYSRCVWWLQI